MDLNKMRDEVHRNAIEKGWWDDKEERRFTEVIALIHSEASEALELYRNGHDMNTVWFKNFMELDVTENKAAQGFKPEGVPMELADIIIRVLDVCGAYNTDIEKAVRIKMAYNATRAYRHGGKRA